MIALPNSASYDFKSSPTALVTFRNWLSQVAAVIASSIHSSIPELPPRARRFLMLRKANGSSELSNARRKTAQTLKQILT